MRIRRTLLWVNGNDLNKLKEAIESNADSIVLELEDMCPANDKEAARAGAVEALTKWDFKGKERGVRINALDSPWGKADLAAVLPCVPDLIRLPKCESVKQVVDFDTILTEFERSRGLSENTIKLILMLETPLGIINAYELALSAKRIVGLGLGAGDLTSAMGVDRDVKVGSLQLLYAKQKIVLDAKAAGIQVFDTTVICPPGQPDALDDYIRLDTEDIKMMGFSGRSVSMLSHIDIINNVFRPTEKEVTLAYRLIKGYTEGMARGESYIFVDDQFLDPPIVKKAQCIIDYAEQLNKRRKTKQQ